MKKENLKQKLQQLDIPASYYSMDGSLEEGAFVLHYNRQTYEVFLFERGNRFELKTFQTESEACEYLYERLKRLKETNEKFNIPM